MEPRIGHPWLAVSERDRASQHRLSGAVGFTALAWTSILVFTGIGLRSTLRFFPRYRPWMYLCTATLFTTVHTVRMAIIWGWHY